MITENGALTPLYSYITKLLLVASMQEPVKYTQSSDQKINIFLALKLTGHLFDTKIINQIYAIL